MSFWADVSEGKRIISEIQVQAVQTDVKMWWTAFVSAAQADLSEAGQKEGDSSVDVA